MIQNIADPNVAVALALLESRLNILAKDRGTLSSRVAILEDDDDPKPDRFDRPIFSGKAYYEHDEATTGLNTHSDKPWVKLVKSTHTFSEETDAPTEPWPSDEHWWEKTKTFGDIHYWPGGGEGVPPGIIVMWDGYEADVPSGWGVCNGTDNSEGNGGTGVDLRGRFIVGVGNDGDGDHATYERLDTGGYQYHGGSSTGPDAANNHKDHDLSHTHGIEVTITVAPGKPHEPAAPTTADEDYLFDNDSSTIYCTGTSGEPSWTGGVGATYDKPAGDGRIGHTQTDNRPPYFALFFIQKLNV